MELADFVFKHVGKLAEVLGKTAQAGIIDGSEFAMTNKKARCAGFEYTVCLSKTLRKPCSSLKT